MKIRKRPNLRCIFEKRATPGQCNDDGHDNDDVDDGDDGDNDDDDDDGGRRPGGL